MLLFWTLASLMILAALWLVVPPLMRDRTAGREAPGDANLALYRERLAELARERDRGAIDAGRHAALREDLERGLLADVGGREAPATVARPPPPWMAAAVAVMVPVCGLAFYLWLGSPHGLDPPSAPRETTVAGAEPEPPVEVMVAALAARLAEDPADAEGWLLLARSQVALERFDAALAAFERAHALLGDEPSLLVDWAEAEAGRDDNRFPAGALRRLERALELDPDHEKALWIGGFAAVQNGRTDIAAARWERLLAGQTPGSREAFIVTELLARIRDTGDAAPAARSGAAGSTGATEPADSGEPSDFSEPADSSETSESARRAEGAASESSDSSKLADSGEAGEPARGAEGAASADGARIVVEVGLAPDLAVELGADEPVFVFARAPSGGGPPIAVSRTVVGALPATIVLDESNAMMASRSLAGVERAVVTARVARSGTVSRTSGDVEGVSEPVLVADPSPVRIVISRIVQ